LHKDLPMHPFARSLARLFAGLSFAVAAHAAADVPTPLEPWRSWVMHGQEFRACPLIAGRAGAEFSDFLCAWPGVLSLSANDTGASISQRWQVDAESWVPLPGNAQHWPQQVNVDGRPAVVIDHGGPSLRLAVGLHEIHAQIPWRERPQTLHVPATVGLVALRVDGNIVAPVRRDGDELTLGRAAVAAPEADSMQLRVYRRLADGVPAMLTTRIEIAVSGQAREEVIGPALPEGFAPLALESAWPARLDADGRLRVRVQPGSNSVVLDARAIAPLATATARVPPTPWPQQEIWSYAAAPQLRVSVAGGALAVDPVQAQVPREWAQLPTFALADAAKLTIEERSRGQDPAAQNQLSLSREMWLDFDGGGWFARDRINGRMLRDWRLDVAAPYALERADAGSDALLVTRGAGAGTTGVEWRSPTVDLTAGMRITPKSAELPVAGWNTNFDGASAIVHLPDGYRLLGAPGADYAHGSWVSAWTLYDVFIAALLALLAWRLLGLPGVLVACAYLVLGYQEPGAPRWTLLAALGLGLALRALPAGKLAAAFEWLRRAALLLFVLFALPFAALQLRNALHPQLEQAGLGSSMADAFQFPSNNAMRGAGAPVEQDAAMAEEQAQSMPAAPPPPASPEEPVRRQRASQPVAKSKLDMITITGSNVRRVDIDKIERYAESTVLQTGAGEANWNRGQRYELGWSGRVVPTQTMSLLIAPPWMVRLLRVVLVGLLAWLGLRLLQPAWRNLRVPRVGTTALLGLLATSALLAGPPARAQTYPPDELLEQLRARLLEAPKCAPACAAFPNAQIVAHGDEIGVALEAHALERVALPLPSDRRNLDLRRITLDGAVQEGVARVGETLWLDVPRGVHRIELAFVAASDKIALDFPLPPPRVAFDGDGWQASGLDDEAHLLTRTLTLVRARANGEAAAGTTQQFSPYVVVERALLLGLDWSVSTQVSRLAPREGGIALALPLLAGEHVTTGGLKVENAHVMVALGEGTTQTGWDGKLDKSDTLTLSAPPLGDHAEVWSVQVGPTWHLESSGVPAIALPPEDTQKMHRFEFHPLPGEQLVLRVTRPEAAQGASRAIDWVSVVRRPGQRAAETTLALTARASQGGEQSISLPNGAELVGSSRDGQALNLRLQDGKLSLPLIPGSHKFEIRWRDEEAVGFVASTPALALGLPAANIDLGVDLPADRWLLATSGPTAGPAVLYWSELALALLLAFALGRARRSPLKAWQWLLLVLGFSTFSWIALLVVVAWLFALDWRARQAPQGVTAFNLVQIGLPVLTVFALLCLLAAVQEGLLGTPDMAVAGNGMDAHALRWFADRSADALPVARAISLPLWVHKVAMLAWALWLASALVGWLRKGFAAWTQGGYWRKPMRPIVDVPQVEPPQATP
jgi:hypothetical protein